MYIFVYLEYVSMCVYAYESVCTCVRVHVMAMIECDY